MKKLGTAIVIGAATLAAATSISAASPAKSTAMGQKNIVQTAVAAGKFKTLVALVKKAGLAGTLSAPGNLTVFAPTDQAFANLKKRDPALYNKVATNKKAPPVRAHLSRRRQAHPRRRRDRCGQERAEGQDRRRVSRSRSPSRAARSSSTARHVW